MGQQLNLKFYTCIFDNFEIPENDDWIFEMKREQDKKFREDIKWISDLIDKYSNE